MIAIPRFFIVSCLLLILLAGGTFAQPRTGRFTETFANIGVTSSISYYVPEDYDSTRTYPLLYAWHGAGMAGSTMRDLMFNVIAQRIKAIVVAPDANNLTTNDQFNNLINASYTRVRQLYRIDSTRRIVTGFSWGGQMSFQLGLLNPLLFDGIIGFSPAIGMGQMTPAMWSNIGHIRMASILGDRDFNFAAVDELMKEIPNRNGVLLYMVKPGVEHADNTYLNSQEFRDDYARCYEFVLGNVSAADTPVATAFAVSIAPSPAQDFVTVSVNAVIGEAVTIELYDTRGVLINRSSTDASNSMHTAIIPTSALPAGLYIARVLAGSSQILRKVLVVR